MCQSCRSSGGRDVLLKNWGRSVRKPSFRNCLAITLRSLPDSFRPSAIFAAIDSPTAAAEAGASSLTHASGKSRGFRWACNHRLRAAIPCFADTSRYASPWAADVSKRARGQGCDYPHAIRYPRPRLDPRPLASMDGWQAPRPSAA